METMHMDGAIDYAALAQECGFSAAAPLDPRRLEFLKEVREMCAADRCRSYNRNWSCPPACGSLEDWRRKCSRFREGLLMQTIGEIEDSFDFEGMAAAAQENRRQADALADRLRLYGSDFLLLTAGTCTRCTPCSWPDAPCRHPLYLFPSMEACGLLVSQVCQDCGLPYYYGSGRIAFTCCVLFHPEDAAET